MTTKELKNTAMTGNVGTDKDGNHFFAGARVEVVTQIRNNVTGTVRTATHERTVKSIKNGVVTLAPYGRRGEFSTAPASSVRLVVDAKPCVVKENNATNPLAFFVEVATQAERDAEAELKLAQEKYNAARSKTRDAQKTFVADAVPVKVGNVYAVTRRVDFNNKESELRTSKMIATQIRYNEKYAAVSFRYVNKAGEVSMSTADAKNTTVLFYYGEKTHWQVSSETLGVATMLKDEDLKNSGVFTLSRWTKVDWK